MDPVLKSALAKYNATKSLFALTPDEMKALGRYQNEKAERHRQQIEIQNAAKMANFSDDELEKYTYMLGLFERLERDAKEFLEEHEEEVFSSTALRFGMTAEEAKALFLRVDSGNCF